MNSNYDVRKMPDSKLIGDLVEYAERYAAANDEPKEGGCRATIRKALAWLEAGSASIDPIDVVTELVEYVGRYAYDNGEPVGGDCHSLLARAAGFRRSVQEIKRTDGTSFPDRVRFNWGFHDGTADAELARVRDIDGHQDRVYADGYARGVLAWKNLGYRPESSDEAWSTSQGYSVASAAAGKLPEHRLTVAQQVVDQYKLNDDVDPRNVTHRGWNAADPQDLQCFVDTHYWVGDELRDIKLDFHVKFDSGGNVVDAYAHDMHRKVVGKRGDVEQAPADGKLPKTTVECSILTEHDATVPGSIEIDGEVTARAVISGMIEVAKRRHAFVNFTFEGVSQQAAWTSNVETLLVLHERCTQHREVREVGSALDYFIADNADVPHIGICLDDEDRASLVSWDLPADDDERSHLELLVIGAVNAANESGEATVSGLLSAGASHCRTRVVDGPMTREQKAVYDRLVAAAVERRKLPETTLVSSEHGFDDYDVKGIPTVHRVTVGHGIRKGDSFNVYCDNSQKIGGVWQGTLEKSLEHVAARLAAEAADDRKLPHVAVRYAAQTLLDAFGGNAPDWLRGEAVALENALAGEAAADGGKLQAMSLADRVALCGSGEASVCVKASMSAIVGIAVDSDDAKAWDRDAAAFKRVVAENVLDQIKGMSIDDVVTLIDRTDVHNFEDLNGRVDSPSPGM